jgi:hypothetical protein
MAAILSLLAEAPTVITDIETAVAKMKAQPTGAAKAASALDTVSAIATALAQVPPGQPAA